MLLGDFERAWHESDFISAKIFTDPNRYWDGRPWKGQHLMLRCLHGLGDTIQFIRYAAVLKQHCCSLTVQTHPQLVTLLQGVPGIDRVCTWGSSDLEDTSDWDLQMEVTELPRALRTTVGTIPATVPYIRVPKERIEWAADCFTFPGRCGWESRGSRAVEPREIHQPGRTRPITVLRRMLLLRSAEGCCFGGRARGWIDL